MSNPMPILEKLTEYQAKFDSLELRMAGMRDENKNLNDEFNKWMTTEFGFSDGPQSLAKILKVAIEKSYAPKSSIIV